LNIIPVAKVNKKQITIFLRIISRFEAYRNEIAGKAVYYFVEKLVYG
jgi:uncharacterized protein YtpQ (UPF0354 family)